MDEKQHKKYIEAMKGEIRTVVNGKIDNLHRILEKQNEKTDAVAQQLVSHLEKEAAFQTEIREHMATVKPYLDGAAGIKVMRSFLVWVGGSVAAWIVIKSNFKL